MLVFSGRGKIFKKTDVLSVIFFSKSFDHNRVKCWNLYMNYKQLPVVDSNGVSNHTYGTDQCSIGNGARNWANKCFPSSSTAEMSTLPSPCLSPLRSDNTIPSLSLLQYLFLVLLLLNLWAHICVLLFPSDLLPKSRNHILPYVAWDPQRHSPPSTPRELHEKDKPFSPFLWLINPCDATQTEPQP